MNTKASSGVCSSYETLLEKQKEVSFKKPEQKVMLIAGPTASGKTKLSLLLAKKLNGEIISADSMQVYRHMDIGTAKISKQIRDEIPHYLIDIRHIQQPFNVVDFYYEAKQCIESILMRKKVPIIVGGTGFYFRALIYGPPKGPPSVFPLRQEISNFIDQYGLDAAYKKLAFKDPVYSKKITKNDKQKIIRALEIVTLTGKKVSEFTWSRKDPVSCYTLSPWFLYRPTYILYERINERCDQMLAEGFLEEVKNLISEGIEHNQSAINAIGYRQAINFFNTNQTPQDYEHFVNEFKKMTRKYVKKQFTWFKSESIFNWVNMEKQDIESVATYIAKKFMEEGL